MLHLEDGGSLRYLTSTHVPPTQGFPSCSLTEPQSPSSPLLSSAAPSRVPSPSRSPASQSTRPGARAPGGGPPYVVHCTSGDSRPAPWVAPLSPGCPASSPVARAAGRGHFSSAPQLPLALSSCRVRTATNLPVPAVPSAGGTPQSHGRTFKNLTSRPLCRLATSEFLGGGGASYQDF